MEATEARTLKQALQAAAAAGASSRSSTFDNGQQVEVTLPGAPRLLFSYEWGEEASAVTRVDRYVAEHRPEDDPRVQHEPVVVAGY